MTEVCGVTATQPHDESLLRLEARRKLTHALPGLIPFALWFIYHEDPLPAWNLAVVAAVVAVLTLAAIVIPRRVRRSASENWRRACITYAIPPVVALCLFPARVEFTSAMLCILAFGDSAAALGGRRWGRRRLPWNPRKTWIGMGCFLAAALPIGSIAYWGEARPSVALSTAFACGFCAAVPAAIAETLPLRIDDNLRISIAAFVGIVLSSSVLVSTG